MYIYVQNRVMHYDVTNRVTNSKTLFFQVFWVVTPCEKSFNIISKLVNRDF